MKKYELKEEKLPGKQPLLYDEIVEEFLSKNIGSARVSMTTLGDVINLYTGLRRSIKRLGLVGQVKAKKAGGQVYLVKEES